LNRLVPIEVHYMEKNSIWYRDSFMTW